MGDLIRVAVLGAERFTLKFYERLSSLCVDQIYLVSDDIIYSNEIKKVCGNKCILTELEKAIALSPNIVIEALGFEKAKKVIKDILKRGSKVILTTQSLLIEEDVRKEVERLTEKGGEVIVPFGATPMLDLIEALSLANDSEVYIEVRRPPEFLKSALKEAGLDPDSIDVEVVVYEGPASAELKRVKEDINTLMAPILALGKDIHVKIIADPKTDKSMYRIEARAEGVKAVYEGIYNITEKGFSVVVEYSVLRVVARECKRGIKVL